MWDETKFETRFDQDPGFKFAVQQDAGDGVLSSQKKVVIMVQVTSPREIVYVDQETKMVCILIRRRELSFCTGVDCRSPIV